jgi:hypothetical protein
MAARSDTTLMEDVHDSAEVSDAAAAALFVREVLKKVQASLPHALNSLRALANERDWTTLNNVQSQFEVAIAVMAVEAQALANLLPINQAERVHSAIAMCLKNPELDDAGLHAFAAYDRAWKRGLANGEPPFDEVASEVFDRLSLTTCVTMSNGTFKSPPVLTAIATCVVTLGGAWWKHFLTKHKIIASGLV